MNFKEALYSLRPTAKYVVRGENEIEWLDTEQTQPTNAEIEAEITRLINDEPWKLIREKRNQLLAETDWTQARDVTLSNDSSWQTYRQQLRDLPASTSNPDEIVWPTKPE